jgi:hypothetical protein
VGCKAAQAWCCSRHDDSDQTRWVLPGSNSTTVCCSFLVSTISRAPPHPLHSSYFLAAQSPQPSSQLPVLSQSCRHCASCSYHSDPDPSPQLCHCLQPPLLPSLLQPLLPQPTKPSPSPHLRLQQQLLLQLPPPLPPSPQLRSCRYHHWHHRHSHCRHPPGLARWLTR